ncbi:extracellular solute-binding protein [Cohnella endophytica]|uniref:Extracellular solute-binding protein n=1 Tax=Cohnella endophytica TaxID=2419778 RepID=A0A494Y8W2_9BACL|nr:extracellular solute-binding protein [Cohnella endophytica]
MIAFAAFILSACGSKNNNDASPSASGAPSPSAQASESASPSDSPSASASASPSDEPQVTVEFWHAYGEGEEKVLLEQVIPKFESVYPSIKIHATRMPTENLDQQVLTAVAGGTPPDIMRMDNTWVSNMAKQGALQEISGFPDAQAILDNSFKGTVDTNLYKGKYYGVPLDTNTRVAIYNQDLLAKAGATEAPKTIDELVDLARNIKKQGKFSGITIGGTNVWDFSAWFWTLGGQYTDPDYTKATGYLNSDASVKALDTIYGWYKEGLLAPPILGGQPGTWEGLRGDKGKAPSYMMITDGPWFFSLIGDADTKGKMLPAVMPAGPDGQSHSVIGGEDLVLFNGAKQPDAAWKFAQFMTSTEIQVLLAKQTGQIPTNKDAAQAPELKDVWYLQAYVDQLATAYTRTPSPNANKINDAIGAAFESVFRGKAKSKDALDKAASQIDGFLNE